MNEKLQGESPDYIELVKKYAFFLLGYWYFVLAGIIGGGVVGYVINRYAQPIYNVTSTVITKKFDNNDFTPMVGGANSLRFKKQVDSQREKAKILSKDNVIATLRKLDFDVSYFIEGEVLITELYSSKPFIVKYDTVGSIPYNTPIIVKVTSAGFTLSSEDKTWNTAFNDLKFQFDKIYTVNKFTFSVEKNQELSRSVNYVFVINKFDNMVDTYKSKISIKWDEKNTTVLNFEMVSSLPDKDQRYMEVFLQTFNERDFLDKNTEHQNVIRFINKQVDKIEDSLFVLDTYVDRIRLSNNKAQKGTDLVFKEIDSLTSVQAKIFMQNSYLDYLVEYVKNNKDGDLFAPVYMGVEDEFINNFVKNYLTLKAENRMYRSDSNSKNPLVSFKDKKTMRFEENMFENIRNIKSDNNRKLNDIQTRVSFLHKEIPGIQILSNQVKQIKRRSLLNEKILSLLLERRTEAELLVAKSLSNYELLDNPSILLSPSSPNKQKTLIKWLLLGFIIPSLIIVIIKYFNPYILEVNQIKTLLSYPIIGEIPHNEALQKLALKESPNSHISEAFRSVRAKLNYFLTGEGCSVIAITSSLSGEGKSFSSVNLASFYAISGKRTVVVGADLRRPSLSQYFPNYSNRGLSNYLVHNITKEELICKTDIDNLYFISAGEIPPNPYELIAGKAFDDCMEMLKKEFDVIVIDTSPLLLVSDALPILKHSDVNILLVRYGATYIKSLESVKELVDSQQLQNFTVLFNDVDKNQLKYKYGYKYKYKYNYYYKTDNV